METTVARDAPAEAWKAGWRDFVVWADNKNIGVLPDEWLPWWECWKDGWHSGKED